MITGAKSACFHLIPAPVWVVFVQLSPTNIFRLERRLSTALHCSPLHHNSPPSQSCLLASDSGKKYFYRKYKKAKQSKSVQTLIRMLCSVSILAVGCTNDRVRISQVRQRLVSSCQVSVSSCPAQTQEAQYAQKKYSQSCIFKAHIFTS